MIIFQFLGFCFAVWLIWLWQSELYNQDISNGFSKWRSVVKRIIYSIILILLVLLFVYGIGADNKSYYQSEEDSYGDIEHYEPKW